MEQPKLENIIKSYQQQLGQANATIANLDAIIDMKNEEIAEKDKRIEALEKDDKKRKVADIDKAVNKK